MPLLAHTATTAPPPPPTPGPAARAPDLGQITAVWTAPDGTDWPLTTPVLGWHTLNAVVAFGAVQTSFATDANPRGGATVRHQQDLPRGIIWPIRVVGDDHLTFLQRWRALGSAFTQTKRRGPGTLTISRPDGTARQISAYYQAGIDGAPGQGWLYDDMILTLFCPDPYFRDLTPTVIPRQFVAVLEDYQNPYPSVSSSEVIGDTTAVNPGDTYAWPTWSITGPTSGVTATNSTTGQAFALDPNATGIAHGPLLTGETVTIVTDPAMVRGPDGTVWTAAVNWDEGGELWGLDQGVNDIDLVFADADDGAQAVLSFYARYEFP